MHTKCLDVCAGNEASLLAHEYLLSMHPGGDLTCFTVARNDESPSPPIVDLLLCGNGQWGGLGNNVFNNAQGLPIRAKNVSGILECAYAFCRFQEF